MTVFRTEQLLELYEAAPDDDNNWGDIVELADNLGKILDHSDSNDSEDEKDKKKEKKKAGKQAGNAVRAKTARLQSALIRRHNEKLQSEISTVLSSTEIWPKTFAQGCMNSPPAARGGGITQPNFLAN